MLGIRWKSVCGLFACATLVGCGIESPQSDTLDIFTADANGTRRRAASNAEKLWTVSMGSCTGAMLTTEYFLTANHCNPRPGATYTSGSGLVNGKANDLTLVSIVEADAGLDYIIAKVRWSDKFPADQKLPPTVATNASDFQLGERADTGDELFAVGFPQDQNGQATYSEGRAKAMSGDKLLYNIGTINGNSGGSVWRKSDKMLVSMTNAGPHQFGDDRWNADNSKDDQGHWNNGVAMHVVFQKSRVLKVLFPEGKNKSLNDDGSINSEVIELPQSAQSPRDQSSRFQGDDIGNRSDNPSNNGRSPIQNGAQDQGQNIGEDPSQWIAPAPNSQDFPPEGSIIYYP